MAVFSARSIVTNPPCRKRQAPSPSKRIRCVGWASSSAPFAYIATAANPVILGAINVFSRCAYRILRASSGLLSEVTSLDWNSGSVWRRTLLPGRPSTASCERSGSSAASGARFTLGAFSHAFLSKLSWRDRLSFRFCFYMDSLA